MSENTDKSFIGQVYFERGDAATSPPTWARACNVTNIGGLGEANDSVDVTTFCSAGNREYIAGLADGTEFTVDGNYMRGDAGSAAVVKDMIDDVKNRRTGPYRVVIGDVSPIEVFEFEAVALSWTFNPAIDDKNGISFGLKVSGPITIGAL